MPLITPNFISEISNVAVKAGQHTLDCQNKNLTINLKKDGSPVTKADQEAEAMILSVLRTLCPETKIIAEEEMAAGLSPTLGDLEEDRFFFLIDALDGTKSYTKGENDFTVNIALIDGRTPCFGIIYCPADDALFIGYDQCAYKIDNCQHQPLYECPKTALKVTAPQIPTRVVASKSHRNQATNDFIATIDKAEIFTVGSSKKFCALVEGKADLYPRFSPTSEWDIAAGDAILRAAGGFTISPNGDDFLYRKENFLNGDFIAGIDRLQQIMSIP